MSIFRLAHGKSICIDFENLFYTVYKEFILNSRPIFLRYDMF